MNPPGGVLSWSYFCLKKTINMILNIESLVYLLNLNDFNQMIIKS